jgi:hypothetical protein
MAQVVTTDTNDCTEIMVYGLPYVFDDRTGTCNLSYLTITLVCVGAPLSTQH